MTALNKTGQIRPTLFINWRGWDNPTDYCNQAFQTVFLPSSSQLPRDVTLAHALRMFNIDSIHIYNAEEIINLHNAIHATGTKLIYEAINIDHVLCSQLSDNEALQKQAYQQQKRVTQLSDYILCRSDIDQNHIVSMGIKPFKVKTYNGGINIDDIRPVYHERNKKNVVFMGHMYYPPNERALRYIAGDILPGLRAYEAKYTISIIGAVPEPMANDYRTQELIFRGGTNNLDQELKRYGIAIAPLLEGSGTRLKILDYLAAGIPTISTSLGVEGLHPSIADCVIIEDDLCKYAKIIRRLDTDIQAYDSLAKRGRKYVERYYNWDNNLDPFLELYRKRDDM
jgi:glycosyltransferase involved in cell wall biosynthesis